LKDDEARILSRGKDRNRQKVKRQHCRKQNDYRADEKNRNARRTRPFKIRNKNEKGEPVEAA